MLDPLTVIVRIAAKHGISKLINALTGCGRSSTPARPPTRADELVRATALFREASAAARSTLQVAVAERYLVLCAIALGRRDAARTALGRLVARLRPGRTRAGPDPPAPLAGGADHAAGRAHSAGGDRGG